MLDIEDPVALTSYLRDNHHIGKSETPRIEVLRGGVSNRTVYVQAETGWVIKQALPKLRVEVDWFSDPARIHREALGLRWLGTLLPAGSVPAFVFEDTDHYLLAMEAVPSPHKNWKVALLAGQLDLEHVRQAAVLLAMIHRRSTGQADELSQVFDDRSFFESLRLEPFYSFVAERVTIAAPFLRALTGDTRERRTTLVHGDFSPKNILIRDSRLVLLDHEVIHWGDPAFDVGFCLAHLLSKAHHLANQRHQFAVAANHFWNTYSDEIGVGGWQDRQLPQAIRHTLGCLMARVAGRSPVEYLEQRQRTNQQLVVTELMKAIPDSVDELICRFAEGVTSLASN